MIIKHPTIETMRGDVDFNFKKHQLMFFDTVFYGTEKVTLSYTPRQTGKTAILKYCADVLYNKGYRVLFIPIRQQQVRYIPNIHYYDGTQSNKFDIATLHQLDEHRKRYDYVFWDEVDFSMGTDTESEILVGRVLNTLLIGNPNVRIHGMTTPNMTHSMEIQSMLKDIANFKII